MKIFAEMIVETFKYLIEEFGFTVSRKDSDSKSMGNAVVVFASTTIGIEIVVDRNQVLMSIGDVCDPRSDWFEFFDVVNSCNIQEVKGYIFPIKNSEISWNEIVFQQLGRLAEILKKDCLPLLQGQPLNKSEIRKIRDARTRELRRAFHL